ncbi:MAG: hypothetical protein HC918_03925 [Oscillatoriales cyanobacterium SM2_1_8]|nr:hypothetical protein [Oscillatoriales cyanobacterium SM2_1_8]
MAASQNLSPLPQQHRRQLLEIAIGAAWLDGRSPPAKRSTSNSFCTDTVWRRMPGCRNC